MRFVAFSDTHGYHADIKLPDGDVLLFAGDMCNEGKKSELLLFLDYLRAQPHRYKILIAGNHDFMFETAPEETRELVSDFIYLQDEAVTIEGVKIYGSPWQPEFYDWAFKLPRGVALKEKWDLIPVDTDVLITHGPPYHFGDRNNFNHHTGCKELANALNRVKPKFHVFGHIHEDFCQIRWNGIHLLNVSSIDYFKRPLEIRPPVVFTYP